MEKVKNKLLITQLDIPGAQEYNFNYFTSTNEIDELVSFLDQYDEITVINIVNIRDYLISRLDENVPDETSDLVKYFMAHFLDSEYLQEYSPNTASIIGDKVGVLKDKLKVFISKTEMSKLVQENKKYKRHGDQDPIEYTKEILNKQFHVKISQQVITQYNFPFFSKDKLENYDVLKIV